MKKIGIISDTHLKATQTKLLPETVLETFQDVDLILHAGDVNDVWVLEQLQELAPVRAVLGNTDDAKVLLEVPISRRIKVEDSVIGLTHGHLLREPRIKPVAGATGNSQTAANALSHFQFEEDVNCVVFGHSHFPLVQWHESAAQKVLLLNPGSAVQKRAAPHCSIALLTVDGRDLTAQQIIVGRSK